MNNKRLFGTIRVRQALSAILLWQLIASGVLPYLPVPGRATPIEAASHTVTSRVDFNKGEFNNTESKSKEGEIKLVPAGSWTPQTWKTPMMGLSNGTAIVSDGTYVYALANNDLYFARYNPKDNTWKTLADAPFNAMYGADMVIIGDYIYTIFGGWQKYFGRYRISTNTWETLPQTLDFVSEGGTISTDGTDIYAVRGGWTVDFWKYTVATRTWKALGMPPADLRRGAGLVYRNGYFYTPRGDSANFYRYEVATDNWVTLPDAPAALSQAHNIDIVGSYIYVTRDNSTNAFYRYLIDDNPANPGSWETLANTPQTTNYVGVVYNASEPGYLYVFRGNGYYDFWKYNIATNTFVGPPDMPNSPGSGADLIYYNDGSTGYIYTPRGSGSVSFYRYNLTTLAWENMADLPVDTNGGSQITFNYSSRGVVAGSYIYFLRAAGNTVNGGYTFIRYNTASGAWEQMANTPAYACGGAALGYTGSGDYIYAARGCGTRTLWRYQISTNTWTDAPATDADLPDNSEAGEGASMTTDGTNLYFIPGYGIQSIWKYAGNTWTLETTTPFAPYWGTDIVWYNGKIYAQAGGRSTEYFAYTPGTPGSWQRLPWGPSYGNTEVGPWNGGSLEKDNSGSFYSIYGAGIWKMNKLTSSSDAYVASGTWTSDNIDLTYVSSFTSLSATATSPSGSSVAFETRTSDDQITWSDWETVSGTTVASPARRYVQIRAALTAATGNTDTPVITDIAINYAGDENPPANPASAGLTVKTREVGGTVIPAGGSSSAVSPYFNWPDAGTANGASDGETQVTGYYIHFGTESSAGDIASWEHQTTSNYTVTSPMTNAQTYHFWIKTEDLAGNVSAAQDLHSFTYTGVNPKNIRVETGAEFATGTNEHISTDTGALKLQGKPGFWMEQRLAPIPSSNYYGSRLAYVSSRNKYYMLTGRDTVEFYEYDLATNTWARKADAPSQFYYGDLTEGPDGYLYALKGRNTRSFWRYDPTGDVWSDVAAADLPTTAAYGTALVYDGSRYIYALRGNGDDAFYQFDPLNGTAGTWNTALPLTDFGAPDKRNNNTVGNGGDLAYDGQGNVYAIQGGSRAGFSLYSTDSEMWSTLPDLPYVADYGAAIEYDSATNAIYYTPGSGRIFFYKFGIDTQTWTRLADTPTTFSAGASFRNIGDGNIYAIRGNSTNNFYKYNIAKNTWYLPNVSLVGDFFRGSISRGFSYGSNIIKGDGNNFYVTRGEFSGDFVKFNESTGEVTKLANIPTGAYYGTEMAYIPSLNRIYATGNWVYRKWWYYSIDTDTWTEVAADPLPGDPYLGASLTYDGSRYLYLLLGNGTALWRYDFQGTDGTRWLQRANVTGSLSYGAQGVAKDGYLYTLRGGNNYPNAFYRYNGTGTNNIWDNLSPGGQALPALNWRIYNTGFLVDGGDNYFYACRAADTNHCFRYSLAGNAWSEIASSSAILSSGTAAAANGRDKIYALTSNGNNNTYSNGMYTYAIQTADSSFEENGTYTSAVHDLEKVYRFADLSLTYTATNNASVIISTRTSSDNAVWSSWDAVSSEKINGSVRSYQINSAPNRYMQVKMEFASSDGLYSPKVDDYTINYYQDADPPTNPDHLDAYSTATETASLTDNSWYNYGNPHFEWPDAEAANGASDSSVGSGVEGYWVYFGTDSSANPVDDGEYATASAYTNTAPLQSGSTYYLRIRTQDFAGNVSAAVWSPFTYKFDNEVPTNPVTISVNPPGYTTVNNYSFTLKGASDSASLLSAYCYKYKTGEETYSDEACITTMDADRVATVSGITAYAGGEDNTFYVRSKDNAGNYNPAYATQIYKFSSDAPSRPDNLHITHPDGTDSNTLNEFAFAWDPPVSYAGQQLGLKYYYWINEKPSANTAVNSLGLSVTYLSKGAFAQREGKNTLYVVAQDEAGNMDYGTGSYAYVDFYSDTTAPAAPANLDISDVSIKETNAWRLALSWDQPTATGSGIAEYRIYRSSTTGDTCPSDPTTSSSFTYIASTTQTSYVDTGLNQSTKYYCITACNYTGGKGCGVASDTVHLYPDGRWRVAPVLVGTASATVKTKSALITWSTNRTSNSFVKYGKSSGDYGAEVGSSTQVTYHEITLTGLDPGTTYYYKEYWTDEDGNMGSSEELTLSTNPAPFISSVKVTNVSIYSAFATFTVRNSIKARVEYGKTLSYGGAEIISTSKTESAYTVALNKLTEGTKYHLRLVAEDDEGNVYAGDDYVFETLPVPKIISFKVQQVSGLPTATLRLLWTSNTAISSIVTYYPSGSAESARDQISLTMKKTHEVILRDLRDDTEYTVIVKGRDTAGNEAVYPSYTVKTAVDFRPPEISNMIVESTIVGVGDDARAQVIVSWDTDEPSTTQIEYAQGTGASYNQTTQEDTSLATNHTVTIPGLSPSKIYHLRAVSKDKAANIAQSPDTVTITPKSTKDALNLVIDNLSKTFGFLKGVKGM